VASGSEADQRARYCLFLPDYDSTDLAADCVNSVSEKLGLVCFWHYLLLLNERFEIVAHLSA